MKVIIKLYLGLSALVVSAGVVAYYFPEKIIPKKYFDQIETRNPEISFSNFPKIVGRSNNELKFNVIDDNSGISKVRILLNGKILSENKYEKLSEIDETISIDYQKIRRLKNVDLKIEAYDSSIWQNKAEKEVSFTTDFSAPRAEILSTEHNGSVGGALFVAMRIEGDSPDEKLEKYISIDELKYRIFPLKAGFPNILKQYQDEYGVLRYPQEQIYVGLIPLPFDLSQKFEGISVKRLNIELVIVDAANNSTRVPIYNRIKDRSLRKSELKLSDEFFKRSIEKLYDPYTDFLEIYTQSYGESKDSSQYKDKFDAINQDFRRKLEQVLEELSVYGDSKLFGNAKIQNHGDLFEITSVKKWVELGQFASPLAAKPTSTFGEARKYFRQDGDKVVSQSRHLGIDLAHVRNSPVTAALDGTVIFTGDFGIYGNTVVIYHAAGLITLYGHLSSISVQNGDYVQKSANIGNSGETGLAGGDHLHFEVRIQGVAVNPFEWLDSNWIKTRISRALDEALKP